MVLRVKERHASRNESSGFRYNLRARKDGRWILQYPVAPGRWLAVFVPADTTLSAEGWAAEWMRSRSVPTVGPTPMLLWCPECGERHVDRGEFRERPHHTHACQGCGMVWRPAIGATVGVRFLPGFKDGEG